MKIFIIWGYSTFSFRRNSSIIHCSILRHGSSLMNLSTLESRWRRLTHLPVHLVLLFGIASLITSSSAWAASALTALSTVITVSSSGCASYLSVILLAATATYEPSDWTLSFGIIVSEIAFLKHYISRIGTLLSCDLSAIVLMPLYSWAFAFSKAFLSVNTTWHNIESHTY